MKFTGTAEQMYDAASHAGIRPIACTLNERPNGHRSMRTADGYIINWWATGAVLVNGNPDGLEEAKAALALVLESSEFPL
jgi:hypothetical protein